jgi:hypothetical protein
MKHKSEIWKEDKIVYKDKCFECNSTDEIHYHHIIPFSQGGTKTIPLCSICHGKVHDRKFTNHREMVINALRKKKDDGMILGRPVGTKENYKKTLEKYPDVVELYHNKKSIRDASKALDIGKNTVHKVYKILNKGLNTT